ncbi:MAG: Zn-ribbon domain-containing OB-fold protein [Thaumarchaeota archaeon]|nr:Zn-ribbon domain-containing OB-fold protein [Nitrososphaerota archaeon]
MPMKERITSVDRQRTWEGEIPFHYEYTAGVSGERFLRGLQRGKILVPKCGNCGRSYLPPRAYCTNCFLEITSYVELKPTGRVSALAESHVDFQGRRSKPRTFAFVTFAGVTGGLVHFAEGKGLRIGSSVRAKFKPAAKRKGTLLDIETFVKT